MPPNRPKAGSATSVASTAREHRNELLAALFRFYDRDAEFENALVELIPLAADADVIHLASPSSRMHDELFQLSDTESRPKDELHPRLRQIRAFVGAVDAVATAYGLDRLGQDGRAQIVAWCDRFLRARASGSLAPSLYGPERLSTARTWFGFEPEVVGMIGPPWRREEWAPMSETRRAARERLERIARDHIRAGLDQIEAELADAGIVQRRAVQNLERDLGWLYRKLRFRESFERIYDAYEPPPDGGVETVRKAVLRVAARLKVDHHGWESGWR